MALGELAQLIYDHDHEMDVVGLKVKYGISKQAVWKYIGRKEEITSASRKGVSIDKKQTSQSLDLPQIDDYVIKFIHKVRESIFLVTPTTLLDVASEAADEPKLINFRTSTGWLRQFRLRHNLDFKTLHGNLMILICIIIIFGIT